MLDDSKTTAFQYVNRSGSGKTVLIRDIEFWGGQTVFSYNAQAQKDRLLLFRCAFRFAGGRYEINSSSAVSLALGGEAVGIEGNARCIMTQCEISDTVSDGLDTRGANGIHPHILEDRCRFVHAGCASQEFANSQQLSTHHYSSRSIRIGSSYTLAGGPCIQDVALVTTATWDSTTYSVLLGNFTWWRVRTAGGNARHQITLGVQQENAVRPDTSVMWVVDHSFKSPYGEGEAPLRRRIRTEQRTKLITSGLETVSNSSSALVDVYRSFSIPDTAPVSQILVWQLGPEKTYA
ncbi:MAG: hypothetical protein SFX74_05120 [Fimbriimonadaceae bacterium]|nr:hypothetical protein [Fimbriimonadaceae bacterium]